MRFFILGAVIGPIGDFCHVYSKTLGFLDSTSWLGPPLPDLNPEERCERQSTQHKE